MGERDARAGGRVSWGCCAAVGRSRLLVVPVVQWTCLCPAQPIHPMACASGPALLGSIPWGLCAALDSWTHSVLLPGPANPGVCRQANVVRGAGLRWRLAKLPSLAQTSSMPACVPRGDPSLLWLALIEHRSRHRAVLTVTQKRNLFSKA